MIKRVNWTEFNGDSFQIFCNDLLSFEFGKNFIPFSAPGADQGYDGLFEGEYQGKKGKWRFQDKFKDPESGRTQGIMALRSDISTDLSNNVVDELYVLFITNVEIKPDKRKELLRIAAETNDQINFDIWDGSKIHTLLTHHPIIRLWYTEEAKHLILEYHECYSDELDPDIESSYNMSNKFYFRQDKLLEIQNFMNDDNKLVAVVNGEAGVGKTRLCIEFFKQYIDNSKEWTALVIVNHQIDFKTLKTALTGTKNYIVLLDDVDIFDEIDIADLITLVKGIRENKVKLLFTVRNYLFRKALNKVSAQNMTDYVVPIDLQGLSPKETYVFLKEYLKDKTTDQHIKELAEMTRGIPIMISAILKVIDSGKPIGHIKKDEFLKQHLSNHFSQFAVILRKDYEVKKNKVDKVLKLIALIEPIAIKSTKLVQDIAQNENISEEDVATILNELQTHHILAGKFNLSIKPDMYSDLLLEEASKNIDWLKNKLQEYSPYMGNMIQNIGYATYTENDENLLVENLLTEFIDHIDNCSESSKLINILHTTYVIGGIKPLLAITATEKAIEIFNNKKHPLYEEFKDTLKYKHFSYNGIHDNLKAILKSLFRSEQYYDSAYKLSAVLYEITQEKSYITNIANFNSDIRFDDGKLIIPQKLGQ